MCVQIEMDNRHEVVNRGNSCVCDDDDDVVYGPDLIARENGVGKIDPFLQMPALLVLAY